MGNLREIQVVPKKERYSRSGMSFSISFRLSLESQYSDSSRTRIREELSSETFELSGIDSHLLDSLLRREDRISLTVHLPPPPFVDPGDSGSSREGFPTGNLLGNEPEQGERG